MTTLGWSAFGSLILQTSAQANTLLEALSYTNVAIAVCAVVAGLVLLNGPGHRGETRDTEHAKTRGDDAAEDLRALARQLRCAESRARLLSLAERLN